MKFSKISELAVSVFEHTASCRCHIVSNIIFLTNSVSSRLTRDDILRIHILLFKIILTEYNWVTWDLPFRKLAIERDTGTRVYKKIVSIKKTYVNRCKIIDNTRNTRNILTRLRSLRPLFQELVVLNWRLFLKNVHDSQWTRAVGRR